MNSYKKLCTEFYDIDKPAVPEAAFEFFSHYAHRIKGPILEPMCGSGRFLLPLMELGFSIDGADASPDMLQACRNKADERGLFPKLYNQFLHQLELPGLYNLVMIPAGSFCLITDPIEIKESIRRLYDHMNPGGILVLEIEQLINLAPPPDNSRGKRIVTRTDGGKIVFNRHSRYDTKEHILHSLHRYDLIKDEHILETEWEEFDLRFYEISEFSSLLESSGFTDIKFIKTKLSDIPEESEDNLIFECVRN